MLVCPSPHPTHAPPLGAGPGSSSGEGGWFEGAAQQFQGGGHQTNHRAHSTAQAEGEVRWQGGMEPLVAQELP